MSTVLWPPARAVGRLPRTGQLVGVELLALLVLVALDRTAGQLLPRALPGGVSAGRAGHHLGGECAGHPRAGNRPTIASPNRRLTSLESCTYKRLRCLG